MSKCYIEPYVIPTADIGKENPLPDIKNNARIRSSIELTDAITEEDRKYIGCGNLETMLPYIEQNGYNRDRKDKIYQAVVLENRYLKAVIIPELGGRLWSVIDKETGKELLYANPVIQPCNIAIRNAWFSGGVEFNGGIRAHNPFTCDNVFARKITMADGTEGVRVYEYERIRAIAYGYDAWLPDDSKVVYIRPRIENRTGEDIWMYWWSNIAVPETPDTRVLVPAVDTFINRFGDNHYVLDRNTIANALDGIDVSYSTRINRSIDFFFRIPKEEKKWITAVNGEGYGLVQCSTKELIGRKLFLWGQGGGGKNWNKFLTDGSNDGYIEIQAGLAYTQQESVLMPKGAVWTWVEGYGALQGDARMLHGEWNGAVREADRALESLFPKGMEQTLEAVQYMSAEAGDFLWMGSGWGALENARRAALEQEQVAGDFAFPENTMLEVQQEWLHLLYKDVLLERRPEDEPRGYVVDSWWREKLESVMNDPRNQHWYAYMNLGVMRYAVRDLEGAKEAFEKSVACKPNAWSYRNLSMLYRNEFGDKQKAAEYMTLALDYNRNCRGLLLDAGMTYLQADRYEKWIEVYLELDEKWQKDGRLQLNYVSALMRQGKYTEAAAILKPGFSMPDMKEADTDLSSIWFDLYRNIISGETGITDRAELDRLVEEKYPLGDLDFRTH